MVSLDHSNTVSSNLGRGVLLTTPNVQNSCECLAGYFRTKFTCVILQSALQNLLSPTTVKAFKKLIFDWKQNFQLHIYLLVFF